jgi:hypothetical protein
MYNITRSHQGSALIVALIIVVLLTIMTTTFLEKVLNLWKTSGGINSSAQSYSLATWLIEEQLMDSNITKVSPWNIATKTESSTFTGRSLSASTGGTVMPEQGTAGITWKWNSPFSSDWNIIGVGEPVQIVIKEGITEWDDVKFEFRVPNIPGESGNTGNVTWGSGIILWTFGYSGASLYASGETEIFTFGDINPTWLRSIKWKNWRTNSGSDSNFWNFYNHPTLGVWNVWSKCAWYQCTLKLSMIRPYISTPWKSYSFLEYRITFPIRIPSQYMVIDSSANMYGYLRSRQVRIPQITTSTATDFAILQ